MADDRLDVHVLTGFLGSGKTTVLRRLLHDPQLADTAVLINEFGAVGLDHLLVDAIVGEPVLLGGGCVCCTLRGDVGDSLRDLWTRRARGDLPLFRRVVIETTGLADPTPIMATVAADLALRHHFRPGQVITTVDAVNGLATLARFPESAQQAGVADMLLVTKRDLVNAEERAGVLSALSRLNPIARIEAIEAGAAPVAALLGLDAGDQIARAARWAGVTPPAGPLHAGITATVIEYDRPISWAAFGLWFSLLAHRHGGRILRMKGILALEGSDTPVLVQAAQHLVHRPEHLPKATGAAGHSSLVLITDGLDSDLIRQSFDVMVAGATTAGSPPAHSEPPMPTVSN
ncbi:MAG TPA: GTP-binding protein [Acidisoma sp.]|uniref:CobW family GTP-binding protein n=1 Tax=Acidisoma sp. TaxID=1872115 RepID=UPI002C4B2828|nr:GTP-binding protein [Acidisoma sp.]HTH99326.1 GTP-binding protein [Acidisoma sp.]